MEQIVVLKEAGIITQEIYESVIEISRVLNRHQFIDDEENIVFLVHIAMASSRVSKQEEIPCIDEQIKTSLKELDIYDSACSLLMEIEKLMYIPFPEYEKDYLLLHLCNAYMKLKNSNNT